MKQSKLSSVMACALLSVSASVFAADPSAEAPVTSEEPLVLSAMQMDEVTAGATLNLLDLLQLNVSPVIVTQIRVLNYGFDVNWTDVIQQTIRSRIQRR